MPGGSSILSMIQKIRDNQALRKKKSYFKKTKGLQKVELKNKIPEKKLTPEDKKRIKEQVSADRRKDLKLTLAIILLVSLLLIALGYYLLSNINVL